MPIIYRPDALGDSITRYLSDQSAREAVRHEEELARRKKLQRTTAIAGGAVAGVVGGAFLAPALGLAGTAAAPGFAAGGTFIPGAAATTGILGSGGALGLGGALALGSAGASIGGAIADEDYVGALGTASNAYNTLDQAAEDQRTYGYRPSPAEKAHFVAAAGRAGTNIGAIRQLAAQQGISIPAALQQAQDYAVQQQSQQAYQTAYQETRGRLDAEIGSTPGYEPQPDAAEISRVQNELGTVDREYAAGNLTFEEAIPRWNQLRGELATAQKGKMVPKGPSMARFNAQGQQVGEMAPGIYENADGTSTAVEYDPKTRALNVKFNNATQKQTLPWEALPPGPARTEVKQQWVQDNTIPGVGLVVPEGFKIQKLIEDETRENAAKLILGIAEARLKDEVITGETAAQTVQWSADAVTEAMNKAPQVQAAMRGQSPSKAQPQITGPPISQEAIANERKLQSEAQPLIEKLQTTGYLSRKEISRLKEIRQQLGGGQQ